MPKVNLGKPKPDGLKELILGRKAALGLSFETLGQKCKMTEPQMKYIMKKHSSMWPLEKVLPICKALDIPINEVRANIRY